jgi:hypothetical protein
MFSSDTVLEDQRDEYGTEKDQARDNATCHHPCDKCRGKGYAFCHKKFMGHERSLTIKLIASIQDKEIHGNEDANGKEKEEIKTEGEQEEIIEYDTHD